MAKKDNVKSEVQVIKVRKKYDRVSKAISFEGQNSRTKQAFKDSADVNNIMLRYQKTGVLPQMIKSNPTYGDFSNPVDLMGAYDLVRKAEEQFAGLPSRVRERFGNNPTEFLKFATDARNREEMGKLGLLKEDALKAKGTASKGVPEGEQPSSDKPAK